MRKSICFAILVCSLHLGASAQLTDGSMAPDFSFQDINGNTHNLYSYLNQGKIVAMDISATWCVPCWNYHNLKVFDSLHTQFDNPGTQTWKTLFIEGDANTTMADLQGTGSNTEGDWVTGANYTIIAPPSGVPLTDFSNGYAVAYYPTFYLVCPNKKVYELKNFPMLADWTAATVNCSAAGIDNIEDADAVTIYPNPAREQAGLFFSLSNSAAIAIRVTDLTGKIVGSKSCGIMHPGDQIIKYDLSRMSSGMYLVTLTIDSGRTITKKLIVR